MTIVRGRDLKGGLELTAEAVVVGTGAGGSIALRELARGGVDVIGFEEGGHHTSADFNQREEEMLPILFQDMGGRTTDDLAIRVLMGRGVGGSTIHNTNLCKRIPDEILRSWVSRYGVENVGPDAMRPAFERIEADLSVTEIPGNQRNPNNEALRIGIEKLGWRGGPLSHNRIGCQQSGFCELGCAYDAKQNALKIVIPQAIAAGARVYADVVIKRVTTEAGRVTGVEGAALGANGEEVAFIRVKAKIVVLAASAVGSPMLALQSGVDDPHEQIGKMLRIHPGAVVAGVFDHALSSQYGIPQSYECTEHISFEEGSQKRAWIVPAFAHPIATACTLPGFGAAHMRGMRDYNKLAVLTSMVHDETEGTVSLDGDRAKIHYEISEPDRVQMGKGLLACAKILFAAGARAVTIPGIPPLCLTSPKDVDKLGTSFVKPHALPMTAVHPMGTMRMGSDPKKSVVTATGEHHHTKGLFVADGSLFPTSLGGPPQIGIYSMAFHLAPHMIAAAKKAS